MNLFALTGSGIFFHQHLIISQTEKQTKKKKVVFNLQINCRLTFGYNAVYNRRMFFISLRTITFIVFYKIYFLNVHSKISRTFFLYYFKIVKDK